MANNNNTKNLNVPNLRFPEFKGEWKTAILGDIVKSISSGKTKPSEGEYNLYGSTGIIGRTPKPDYKGEMLLVARVGANAGYLQLINEQCGITDNTLIVVPTDVPPKYLYYFLLHLNLNRLVFGSGQPLITGGMLKKIKVQIGTKKEQDKISNLLSLLDERITTQNKIIDKLQSLIKELIDALLENPAWEKAYLSSFMHFFSTNSLSWKQLSYTEGEIRNLHYGLIHGFQTRGIDTAFLPKILQRFVPKQYTLCQAGDVAFADASEDTNEIGKAIEFISTIDSETVCGLHTIHGRDIKNKTLIGFKGYVFNSRYFHDQVRRLAQGTQVFSITANNLSSCFVYIPELAKQKNIVNLLNAYEELLSTNKMLLKQYEIQKSYLLQQMFI